MPVCGEELTTFLSCSMALPLSKFECSEEGTPALMEGACESEQEAVARCITQSP